MECGPVFCSCSNHCNNKLTPQRGTMHMKKNLELSLDHPDASMCWEFFWNKSGIRRGVASI